MGELLIEESRHCNSSSVVDFLEGTDNVGKANKLEYIYNIDSLV